MNLVSASLIANNLATVRSFPPRFSLRSIQMKQMKARCTENIQESSASLPICLTQHWRIEVCAHKHGEDIIEFDMDNPDR